MNIPRIKGRHLEASEIAAAAELLHGIGHLYVTGGEPTLHPLLGELAAKFREMFGCRRMTLATNGFRIRELGDALRCFDDVFISHYEDNQAEVEYAKRHLVDILAPGPTRHIPLTHRAGNPAPCFRALEGIAYAHGRLHPCCVVLGPEGGVPLTRNWRKEILDAPLPCASCCFAVEADSPAGLNTLHSLGVAAAPWLEGVHADGWMGARMIIHIPQECLEEARQGGDGSLDVRVLSYGPASVHPMHLEAVLDGGARFVLDAPAPGEYMWRISLGGVPATAGSVDVEVESRMAFNPARLLGETHNDRDISVLIASVRVGRAAEDSARDDVEA